MYYEFEQKHCITKHPIQNSELLVNSSVKTNGFEDSLKFGAWHQVGTTQHVKKNVKL